MKNEIQEYFYYSRRERNGALILISLIFLLAFLPRLYPVWFPPRPIAPDPFVTEDRPAPAGEEQAETVPNQETGLFFFDPNLADEKELLALGLPPGTVRTILNYRARGGRFRQATDLKKIYGLREADYERMAPYIRIAAAGPETSPSRPSRREPVLVEFDPNTADEVTLLSLGLSQRNVSTLLNFRNKGGRFRQPEDLKKIYGLSETTYQQLAPFIRIKESAPPAASVEPEKSRPPSATEETSLAIDINRATPEEWQQLKGIGPAYAGRITRFRDALGGFTSVEQVAETYGLPDSTFQSIRDHLQLSPVFRPLYVNQATREELQAHPYLNKKQARILVDYRSNHGPFLSAKALIQVRVLRQEDIDRLLPYLRFEEGSTQEDGQ